MESYILNDIKYDFKPIEIFEPDPNYREDKEKLQESIEKNKAIIERVRERRRKYSQEV